MRKVLLYTVGQGYPLFERYGHTLLCVRESGEATAEEMSPSALETGRCIDYGVSDAKSGSALVWGTLRGEPMFVATEVAEKVALDSFRGEGRSIERQELALEPAQSEALADLLLADIEHGFRYAYDPRLANCASYPRDRIDQAVGGQLKAEALARPLPVDPQLARYRDQLEAGLSGHTFELTVAVLIAGTPADPEPDAWATMYQPERLRDGVARYLKSPVEMVAARVDHPLPTSTVLGHGVFVLLALLFGWRFGKGAPGRWALGAYAALLGILALCMDFLALLSVWSELSHNWVLALLWPTDVLLPWMKPRILLHYARFKVAVCALIALGELLFVVHQPILAVAAFAGLPMLSLLLAARRATQGTAENVAV